MLKREGKPLNVGNPSSMHTIWLWRIIEQFKASWSLFRTNSSELNRAPIVVKYEQQHITLVHK